MGMGTNSTVRLLTTTKVVINIDASEASLGTPITVDLASVWRTYSSEDSRFNHSVPGFFAHHTVSLWHVAAPFIHLFIYSSSFITCSAYVTLVLSPLPDLYTYTEVTLVNLEFAHREEPCNSLYTLISNIRYVGTRVFLACNLSLAHRYIT